MVMGRVVDLFSGGGGFGLGAEMAGLEVKVAIDVEPILQSAYRINMPKSKCINADLAQLEAGFWKRELEGEKVTAVIGGPPCQGFSSMGKRGVGDLRNLLLGHFFRHVMAIKPKFFVLENVVGLLQAGNLALLQEAMAGLGDAYQVVGPVVLNAADFGAATNRNRMFVVGCDRLEMAAFDLSCFKRLYARTKKKNSVRDAIADLPSPSGGLAASGFNWHRLAKRGGENNDKNSYQNNCKNNCENGYDDGCGSAVLSPYALAARRSPVNSRLGWRFACTAAQGFDNRAIA